MKEFTGMSRRNFAWLLASLAGCSLLPRSMRGFESLASITPSAWPVGVVDVHIHLFNANFLPVEGVLRKWLPKSLAAAVAAIVSARTDDCSSHLDGDLASLDAVRELGELEAASEEEIIEQLYLDAPDDLFRDKAVLEGLSSVAPGEEHRIQAAEAEQRKQAARAAFFKTFRRAADERPKEIFPKRGGFLQWLSLLTWCEHRIWAAVKEAYPQAKLFVAHMMDMENYYRPSRPHYPWPEEQLTRMRGMLKAGEGRLLVFFAFDPARQDWRDAVRLGQAAGCAGVKFYPPNGYPPYDLTSGSIPRNSREFFAFCIDQQLPVLTHCTSHGFEAKRGNGRLYADPRLWRRVLEESGFDRLRLCFGHAGGEPGWFPRALDLSSVVGRSSFSSEVLDLCREFPNVYCETAYLSPILKQDGRDRFQRALRKALTAPAQFPLIKKLMYGSDWHMIHRLQDHRLYLPSFVSALGSSEWDGLRDDFFFRNAVRWLDLPAYLDRTAKTDAPWFNTTARCYLENLCALAGTPVPDRVCTTGAGG